MHYIGHNLKYFLLLNIVSASAGFSCGVYSTDQPFFKIQLIF